MTLSQVTIAPRQQGKGRAFSAHRLTTVTADALWEGGKTDANMVRPVFAAFLASEAELRPFVANLMLGRPALMGNSGSSRKAGYEFLRSAGYKFTWQREAEGAIVSVFLPDLFLMDPGMVDPEEAKFVLLAPKKWAAAQDIPTAAIVKHAKRLPLVKKLNAPPPRDDYRWRQSDFVHVPVLSEETLVELAPVAYLFTAYLDRRTRAPIPADGRFYLQLLLACLKQGLATWAVNDNYSSSYNEGKFGKNGGLKFSEDGTDGAGFLPGIAFYARHDVLETLLAEEITTYFEIAKGGK